MWLYTDKSGSKRWVFRATLNGKRRDWGLGSGGLAQARARAAEARKLVGEGKDPSEHRKALLAAQEAERVTFEDAARKCFEEHKAAWRNSKHRAQWLSTLETYAFPKFGSRSVGSISSAEVMECLSPIWLEKPETARRIRQRISATLDWATAQGYRNTENPCRTISRALPKQPRKDRHHPALPYPKIPEFVVALRGQPGTAARALEFAILTASRTSETLQAKWAEVDFDLKIWTIPAERMKAGREHRVPLSPQAIALLETLKEARVNDYIFPGSKPKKPLSNMAMLKVLKRMKRSVTAHGFRSTFRDWAAEATSFPREVCEQALAHVVENKVEAAYRRSDLFEKRSKLMAAWAGYCVRSRGNVVALTAAKTA